MRPTALSANLLSSLKKCGLCRRKAYGDACIFPHLIAPPPTDLRPALRSGSSGAAGTPKPLKRRDKIAAPPRRSGETFPIIGNRVRLSFAPGMAGERRRSAAAVGPQAGLDGEYNVEFVR
jgi:hypothetical protein